MTTPLKDLPEILYHGTTTAYLESKLGRGLIPGSSSSQGVCLTASLREASYWAKEMAPYDMSFGHPCEPIVFAIPLERLDPESLKCDQNSMSLGNTSLLDASWEISFEVYGTLRCVKVIPISENDIVKNVDFENGRIEEPSFPIP